MLLQDVVLIDGISRTGKSLFSPVMGGFKGIEQIQFFNYIEHLVPGVYLNQIDHGYAKNSLIKMLNEKIYDVSIGRNVNFREQDQTGVQNHPFYQEYIDRQKLPEGNEAISNLANSNNIFPIQTHDILTNGKVLRTFDLGIKIIEILRNPIDVVDSWERRGWGTRFIEDEQSFTLLIESSYGLIPWYAHNQAKLYLDSNPLERCILNVCFLFVKLQTELSLYPRDLRMMINLDRMYTEPKKQIYSMSSFLNKEIGPNMDERLIQARVPRDLDLNARKIKTKSIKDRCSDKLFDYLINTVQDYDAFLLNNLDS